MIRVNGISKQFGSLQALDSIGLHVRKGEFYGLLGPNGAGKTTMINIMSTLLQPDAGQVHIHDIDIAARPKEAKGRIGVVPQEISLYGELTAQENLKFWGSLYGLGGGALSSKIEDTLHLMGLYDRRNDIVENYSGGMKRRINIASAILHEPAVLFMDEPTVGIDPQSRNRIYEIIESLRERGMTIVYTTHYMEEAERFCDRIGIIDSGRLIAEGSLDELIAKYGGHVKISLSLESLNAEQKQRLKGFYRDKLHAACYTPGATASNATGQNSGGNARGGMSKSTGLLIENADFAHLLLETEDVKTDLSGIVATCSQLDLNILHVRLLEPNLESVFLDLTGRQLRD